MAEDFIVSRCNDGAITITFDEDAIARTRRCLGRYYQVFRDVVAGVKLGVIFWRVFGEVLLVY